MTGHRGTNRTARVEHDALLTALEQYRPPCRGDARFTDDDQRATDLAMICARCSILPECGEYADAAHPAAGIWAGRRWTTAPQRARAPTVPTTHRSPITAPDDYQKGH